MNDDNRFPVDCRDGCNQLISVMPWIKIDSVTCITLDLFRASEPKVLSRDSSFGFQLTVMYPSPELALINTRAVAAELAAEAPDDG